MTLSAVITTPTTWWLSRQEQEVSRSRVLSKNEALTELEKTPHVFRVPISGDILEIEIIGEPPWFAEVIQTLARFLLFEPNWDSYGGEQIDLRAVISAIGLIGKIMEHDTPPPAVIPTSSGSIQYEWHQNDIDLEIEILSPHSISWFFRDLRTAETDEEEQRLNSDLSKLINYVERLSERNR
jgi:hypothetical protein